MRDGWQAYYDAECLTLEPFEKDAAFQLSAMVKAQGSITESEVEIQAHRIGAVSGPPIHAEFGGFNGWTVSYADKDVLWRRYWLALGNLLVFATLNGSSQSWQRRETDVEAMLSTLEDRGIDA
jgi:hypothetical protein